MSATLWSCDGLAFKHGAASIALPRIDVAAGATVSIVFESIDQAHVAARMCVGFDPPQSGRIELFGLDTARTQPADLLLARRRLGYAAAEPMFLSTVPLPENVAIPLRDRSPLGEDAMLKESAAALAKLGVVFEGRVLPQQASAATRYLCGLSRALAPDPDLAVIEEPPNVLTRAQMAAVRALLAERAAAQRGAMILLVADTMTRGEVIGTRIEASVRHQ